MTDEQKLEQNKREYVSFMIYGTYIDSMISHVQGTILYDPPDYEHLKELYRNRFTLWHQLGYRFVQGEKYWGYWEHRETGAIVDLYKKIDLEMRVDDE